jgi:hypothetical protein
MWKILAPTTQVLGVGEAMWKILALTTQVLGVGEAMWKILAPTTQVLGAQVLGAQVLGAQAPEATIPTPQSPATRLRRGHPPEGGALPRGVSNQVHHQLLRADDADPGMNPHQERLLQLLPRLEKYHNLFGRQLLLHQHLPQSHRHQPQINKASAFWKKFVTPLRERGRAWLSLEMEMS